VRASAHLVFRFLPDDGVNKSGINAVTLAGTKNNQIEFAVTGRRHVRRNVILLDGDRVGLSNVRSCLSLNGGRVCAIENNAGQVRENEKCDNRNGRKFKRAKVGNKSGQVHQYPFSM
jgi:hypothetical protein